MKETYGYTTHGASPVTPLANREVGAATDEVRGTVLFTEHRDEARLYHNVGEGWRFIGTVHYDGRVSEP